MRYIIANMSFLIACVGMLLGLHPVTSHAKATTSMPLELLKSTQQKLEKILKKKLPTKAKVARAAREKKIRKIIKPYFAFGVLARRSLGKHWSKRSSQEKTSFTFWLRALMEQAYLRGVRSNAQSQKKAEIIYKKQKVKGNKATVFTIVRYLHVSKRRKRKRWKKVRVDWAFILVKKQWKIVDISTNDNSLIDTYQEQFDKIIDKKGYKELVHRIKKKVNQLRQKQGLHKLAGPKETKAPA